MPAALDALRARLAELTDLSLLGHLAVWDQRTMMPPDGGPDRANQFATLSRLHHERATAEEVGEWLDALDAASAELDGLDRDIVRLARRDYDRQKCVPGDLAAELAQASAAGQDIWEAARAANDYAKFAPALARNVELARAYADCFDGFAGPYDALLADYDYGLTAERIQEVFGALGTTLPPLVAELSARPQQPPLEPPVAAQERPWRASCAASASMTTAGEWTSPATRSPPTSGQRDSRITTRYEDGQLESLLAAMHEFGHALYDRQIAPELARTSLGDGTSMSIHESQSKLWENHVGRHPAFAGVLAQELIGRRLRDRRDRTCTRR